MNTMPHIIEISLFLLVAFLLGCVLGYVLRAYAFPPKRNGQAKSSGSEEVAPEVGADGRPAALVAPRDGRKDDLKRIKGVGLRIENTLNELGIFHLDQIAGWDRKTIAWIDDYLSFRGRIDREKWVQQARKLVAGES
jgi:predicted flap endonuclease-1-like 5' DNA nuclease